MVSDSCLFFEGFIGIGFILQLEAEAVSERGVAEGLGEDDANVGDDGEVHGLLHGTELVGGELGVQGHLCFLPCVDHTAEQEVRVGELRPPEKQVLQAEGVLGLPSGLPPHQLTLEGEKVRGGLLALDLRLKYSSLFVGGG